MSFTLGYYQPFLKQFNSLIEDQFNSINRTLYSDYDPQRLNESYYVINSTLNAGYSTGAGYMFATLKAYNATGQVAGNGSDNGTTPANNDEGKKSKNTSLAM